MLDWLYWFYSAFTSIFSRKLTSEKRFSISNQSRELMRELNRPIQVTIFSVVKSMRILLDSIKATRELLEELNIYATQRIAYQFVNPSEST